MLQHAKYDAVVQHLLPSPGAVFASSRSVHYILDVLFNVANTYAMSVHVDQCATKAFAMLPLQGFINCWLCFNVEIRHFHLLKRIRRMGSKNMSRKYLMYTWYIHGPYLSMKDTQ